jgi:1-acyl-sn-glycerol-3-phosphate acyltransferase
MRNRLKLWRQRWGVPVFYWWAAHTLRAILWILGRWVVTGRDNVPKTGPLLVVSNHLNNGDPPIIASAIKVRRIRFMAKIELFKLPFGIVPRAYGAFPVRRFEADAGALLNAERILRHDGAIGMFPEGTRSRTGHMGKVHPGTAVIALRSGATILPCALTGSERLKNPLIVFKRPRITVSIGEPISVEKVKKPTEAQVTELTERVVAAITAMLPEDYRPSYTGSEAPTGPEDEGQVANGDTPRE